MVTDDRDQAGDDGGDPAHPDTQPQTSCAQLSV